MAVEKGDQQRRRSSVGDRERMHQLILQMMGKPLGPNSGLGAEPGSSGGGPQPPDFSGLYSGEIDQPPALGQPRFHEGMPDPYGDWQYTPGPPPLQEAILRRLQQGRGRQLI